MRFPGIRRRFLDVNTQGCVAAYLREGLRQGQRNDLVLLDFCEQPSRRGNPKPRVFAFLRGDAVCGVVALSPVLTVDSRMDFEVMEGLDPLLTSLRPSVLKCPERLAAPLWDVLCANGYRAELDRIELSFVLETCPEHFRKIGEGVEIRPAKYVDFPALVEAARASLLEEGRPDPFRHGSDHFRAWVRSRAFGARVVELEGEIVFILWVDVMRPEGWLLQGVYTWPTHRREGLARAALAAVCREAFEAGAEHVQLSVVEGNEAAIELYQTLGFRSVDRLRTVLFC